MDVFRARLRRVGSSLGVIVPKNVVDQVAKKEGDYVEVAILPLPQERQARLASIIGMAPGIADGWKREKKDRF